ncbi:sigma-70 family RNA polymerase sigma factor [Chengkuizengella axinellae]|uniref:Sigma-70 family RNA polymerase sigma factor n=1 Tax=Chengkuizengella axinellae TaxID=3064388 RepID=A0ABT9J260_9BACL|nr:sigma-70 family RNA polymerase sigma factor [Chengkuizengella sp. 2205SS18-9]MDP5275578.1 sigma-70 family RNA polymerase sigma factor [Chengkuizengella sp. 2205SS18-9]
MELDQLVKQAQKQNDEAFYELISIHKNQLYKVAYSYFKNEQDALDALQEVTYRAYFKIKKVQEPQYFSTWLIRIMLNYCTDEMNRRNKQEMKMIERDKAATMDEHLLAELEFDDLIDSLDPKYQQIIKLKYVNDLTISQISEVVQYPEGTVKTWLYKSLKLIRKQLESEGGISHVRARREIAK